MNLLDQKITLKEKIHYGAGDFASSMFWKLFSMYLLFFYTDVFGISAAAVGTMFLVTRIWDALNDPIMGIVCDRTQTRWGKFRPYLLFGAIPFGIVGVLTFTTPDLSSDGKLIYAYITYTLMMMAYTAVNVPYGSLMAVMTNDGIERTSLASWRFIGAFSGGLFVTSTANFLIEYWSGENGKAVGFQYTIGMYAVLAMFFFVFTFFGTKERLAPPKEEKSSLKDDLKDLSKNIPWFVMLGANIAILIFNSLRDGSILFYFKYYVKEQMVVILGESYVLSDTVLSSVYMSLWLGSNIIGVIIARSIAARFGKKRTFIWSALISAILSFIFFFIPGDQLIYIFSINLLIGISAGIILPIGWSMYADIADYSEWKTGRRATGLVFSSSSMSQKFGWTLGGAITGWLLAGFGFEPNVVQTEEALLGIRLMISIIAGLGALASCLLISLYKLDEKFMFQINTDLKKRLNKKY